MLEKVFDTILALAFLGLSVLGATIMHYVVRTGALMRVREGLSSTYEFTKRLTGQRFEWDQ